MKHLLANKYLVLIFALIYSLALLCVSLIKINEGSLPIKFHNADKVFHFFAYFGLALLWLYYDITRIGKADHRRSLWICALAVVFGIIIEILQRELTSYRGFEVLDILADTFGVVLAFMILILFKKRVKAS